VAAELGLDVGGFYAYKITGGSNLDLPDEAYDAHGRRVSLENDVYPTHGIILCISTYSATAPLTAFAKHYGFRGATLHGVNEIILSSGLSVDYREVSREAEKLRLALTRADAFEIDFEIGGNIHTLKLIINQQEAHKSHGLCPPGAPDVANLPAGEVYYVPTSAEGTFPMYYEDGTIGLMHVENGHVVKATLIEGHATTVAEHNAKLSADPATGVIGELGFGTQRLPVSGRDIQDEKILGTLHVATGRSDHLGGDCVPDSFTDKSHATHDDILFAPFKTPKINVPQARMFRNGKVTPVIENFKPTAYLLETLARS
jgi:aminopeptidase